ncbi:P-loop NTPase family protein [Streptosporangium sandarakinum]|uniref:S-DNA-T family DNA segregation ATPase FtsK/SpoIIIE n=1 Tax=Streptosporangium sandarakinum TaxID=1260955 RepID=A0A852UZL0_9ACTN|nr:ATP-binding protein [Streptosporangium sandarakinum]NYF40464.1 S-DNA-T family DNA segregation ATPase FtsK/SpoIIIE [Streptosporangium sandarakinum]
MGDLVRFPQRRDADAAPPLPLPARADAAPAALEGTLLPRPETTQAADVAPLPMRITGRVIAARDAEQTAAIVRAVLRTSLTIGQGWHSWLIRSWDALTLGVYRKQIRAAEAMGDRDALAEWVERKERAVQQRHARLMDLPLTALNVAKFLGISLVGALVLLLLLSLAVWATGVGEFGAVFGAVGALVRGIFQVVAAVWTPLLVCSPAALLLAAWREGRRRGITPVWLAASGAGRDDTGAPITPSIVVTALRDLNYAPLRKAIKEMGDAGAAMLSPIRIAGCGVEVDVTLPSGSSTDEVQKRRRKLAENLGRHEHELFITIPQAARTVRLWIADSGALDEPIGPSPLVTDPEMKADYKSGRAPWGQDLRGDAAAISLYQRHLLITGLSNQGKTASLRALALWLGFDPKVEFRIGDLKGVGDWAMFDGLATVLIQGPTDEHVIAVTEMVEEGVREMERRLLAKPGTRFAPLILIVDEAQVAFMCPAKGEDGRPYGGTKATSRYFMAARKLQNQGRAVDVLLWQGTQNPTDANLPVLVREGAHIRTSLAVGTESQSRMALGDKAVDGGASPHLLRQGLDKGTLVSNGEGLTLPTGQSSITIRTHYISDEEAVEVADRAKAHRKNVTTRASVVPEEQIDPYADIADVLGDAPRMPTQEVLQRLTERNPGTYREWTFADLKRVLEGSGAEPYKSDGRMVISRDRILTALAQREQNHRQYHAE